VFLGSLPPCPIAWSLEELAAWWRGDAEELQTGL
jgi:hypothetical protein